MQWPVNQHFECKASLYIIHICLLSVSTGGSLAQSSFAFLSAVIAKGFSKADSSVLQDASASTSTTPDNAASFALSFLWLEKNVAVAVDQVFGEVSLFCMHLIP